MTDTSKPTTITSQSSLAGHIWKDVNDRLTTLVKRRSKWRASTLVLSLCGAFFLMAGCWLLIKGQLPDEIELPALMLEGAGKVRSSLQFPNNRASSEQALFGQAIKDQNWAEANKRAEQITSTKPAAIMLKAQIAYLAGDKEKSIALIKSANLSNLFPEQIWRIEALYAESTPKASYPLSKGAWAYKEGQEARRYFGITLIKVSGLFVLFILVAGLIMRALSGNIQTIESWLNAKRTKSLDI